MYKVVLSLLLTVLGSSGFGQTEKIEVEYFSFMVLPYLNDQETLGQKLQDDADLRNTIVLLEERFTNMGFKVYDFSARYEQFTKLRMIEKLEDRIAPLLNLTAPDIYCEVDISQESCDNKHHKARVTVKTYLTHSGLLLASKTIDGNCFVKEVDYLSLIKNAINFMSRDYLDKIKEELSKMKQEGQPFMLNISIPGNQNFSFDALSQVTIGGELEKASLADNILIFFDESALVKFYKSTGQSENLLRLSTVKIPLLDTKTNKIYNVERFLRVLKRHIRKIALTKSVGKDWNIKVVKLGGITTLQLFLE